MQIEMQRKPYKLKFGRNGPKALCIIAICFSRLTNTYDINITHTMQALRCGHLLQPVMKVSTSSPLKLLRNYRTPK